MKMKRIDFYILLGTLLNNVEDSTYDVIRTVGDDGIKYIGITSEEFKEQVEFITEDVEYIELEEIYNMIVYYSYTHDYLIKLFKLIEYRAGEEGIYELKAYEKNLIVQTISEYKENDDINFGHLVFDKDPCRYRN